MDLKRKTDKVCIVVNPKKESPNPLQELEQIQDKILNSPYFVASIIHDCDKLQNGELKALHLHIYMELHQKTTLKAVLSDFMEKNDVLAEQISIDSTNNDYLMIQYLTHKNDIDKHHYPIDSIKTNNNELMLSKWNKTYKSEEQLRIEIFEIAPNTDFLDLVKKYGYQTINPLRPMIKDIKAENQTSIKQQERIINHQKTLISDLTNFIEHMFANINSNLDEKQWKLLNLEALENRWEKLQEFYNDFNNNR